MPFSVSSILRRREQANPLVDIGLAFNGDWSRVKGLLCVVMSDLSATRRYRFLAASRGRIRPFDSFAHVGKLERPLPLPESISRPVLGGGPLPGAAAATPMEKA